MQCTNCQGNEFQKTAYGYQICSKCGAFYYDDRYSRKKPKPLSDIYFILIIGTGVMIITILILLFVTASGKKDNVKPGREIPAVSAEKK